MKGYIGCDAVLAPGTVIQTGHALELRVVIVRAVTEDEARESAAAMGMPLDDVAPGEKFYEVETTIAPVSGAN